MISSFFGKSKPINILIVAFLISFIFIFQKFEHISTHFNVYEILKLTGFLLLTIFTLFVIDFIIGKNNITQKNSYSILLFGLFTALIPETLNQFHLVLSNLFILFALRRLISLHSKIDIKKKLFDAGFWIGMATLCYFWAILFFIVIIVALLYYSQNDLKNWIIPFVALLVVLLITVTFNLIAYDSFLSDKILNPEISLDFSGFNNLDSFVRGTVLILIFIWSILFFMKSTQDRTKKLKPAYRLISVSAIIAFLIAIISPIKTRNELIFSLAPLAIMMTIYFESVHRKWIIDIILGLLILIPITLLVL